jgi:TnsA endonuclease N terminal
MAYGYKQGFFSPKFPKKYIGDPTNIVYRSGWEKRVMQSLDENTSVIRWASEEIVVPYISPIDNRPHRYFVDFYVEARAVDGSIKKMLLEVKPAAQTQPPKSPKRKTKRYISEVMTYGVNEAKWKAAQEFCKDKGWEFRLITEAELFKKPTK